MDTETSSDTRRKILFLSFLLGLMLVLALFLAFVAVTRNRPALIAVMLPMAMTSIPLAKELTRLRRARSSSSEADDGNPPARW